MRVWSESLTTSQKAFQSGAKVYKHKKLDFAEVREFGLKQTHADWIIYIDADERISSDLAKEISETIKNNNLFAALKFPRINYYLGSRWPTNEIVTRLFQKKGLKGWSGQLHESPRVEGSIGILKGAIIHHTHTSISEMVENTLVWSQIEAKLRFAAGHPPVSWWRIPRVMLPVFFDYYLKQGGWRVGTVGLIESIYQAFSIFITYARLWEMQK